MRYQKLITAAVAAMLVLPIAASAQTLKPGKWTGTATPPGQGPVPITFDVKVAGDTVSITVDAGEHGSYKLEDVKVTADKVTFWFVPGPKVNCSLAKREDGSFAGNCMDESGEVIPMTMVPPKEDPGPNAVAAW
jgi:hypothetical protein